MVSNCDSKSSLPTEGTPDIVAVMAKIRQRVKEDVNANRDSLKPFQGVAADFHAKRKAGEIVNSEELRYLNTHYAYGPQLNLDAIKSHRWGPIGKIIVKAKRKLLTMIWDLMKDYFVAERDYQANLVRLLNDFSKYVDARDASNFWELIRKLDVDINRVLDRVEKNADDGRSSAYTSEERILNELHSSINDLRNSLVKDEAWQNSGESRIATLERVTSGLESVIARLGKDISVPKANESSLLTKSTDYSYLLLENRSRGSEEDISKRLEVYPPVFKGSTKPVLDIGQGRGELLELFKRDGINAYGVDLDYAMSESCKAKGLDAYVGDAIAHLRSLEDGSLGGVIAIQVVEHLTREQLEELVQLCKRKVEKGGRIVFETINPQSVLALSSNFYRDLTHVWPLHPDTLSYVCEMADLKVIEVKKLSPVPPEAMLASVPIEDYMTPRWAHTVRLLNQNIHQLNALLYGYQDYCVVAEA